MEQYTESLASWFVREYSLLCKEVGLREVLGNPFRALMDARARPKDLKILLELHARYRVSDTGVPYLLPHIGTREIDDDFIGSLYREGNGLINGIPKASISEKDVSYYSDFRGIKIPIAVIRFNSKATPRTDVQWSVEYINPV